jgi:hypothetical protein
MTPEGRIKKAAIEFAKTHGVETMVMVLRSGVTTGWPDTIFLVPGRPLFIEFKRPGKEPTPLQYHRLEHLQGLGYDVFWVDNSDAARAVITQALDASRLSAPSGAVSRECLRGGFMDVARVRQNLSCSSGVRRAAVTTAGEKAASHSAAPSLSDCMAAGSCQVERVSPPAVQPAPRQQKRRTPKRRRRHLAD